MLKHLHSWLVGNPASNPSGQETRAAFTLFLVIALCFNVFPPDFSFNGISSEGADGSLFNQVFWIGVLLLSVPAFLNISSNASSVYLKALPLLAFCVLFILSSAWSLAPSISLRRSILELIVVVSILANVITLQRSEHVFIILYRVASFALAFELVMLFRANGFDEAGYFRGVHTQKNGLGLLAALSLITGVWIRKNSILRSNHWNTVYLFGWLLMLTMSQSKTSLGLVLLAPAIALALRKLAHKIGTGVGIPLLLILCFAYAVFAVSFIAGVAVGAEIETLVHRIGFTGRDNIWQFLIARFLEEPWIGYGYGGFWDIGPAAPNLRYGTGFIAMLNQAHNGYLDLLLAVGVIGLILYIFVIIGYLRCLSVAERQSPHSALALSWILVVFSLLHNLTESTLARSYSLVWVIQVIAMTVAYRMAQEGKVEK